MGNNDQSYHAGVKNLLSNLLESTQIIISDYLQYRHNYVSYNHPQIISSVAIVMEGYTALNMTY